MPNNYIVSSSPHVHTSATIQRIMLDVIIALVPTTVVGVYFFGFYSALVIAAAITTAAYHPKKYTPIAVAGISAIITSSIMR